MVGSEYLYIDINSAFFDENPMPMWIGDRERIRFLAVNQAALEHYGYSRDEFLSLSPLDIRPKEDIPEFLKSQREINTLTNLGIFRHLRKNGSIMKVEVFATDILFKSEKARLIICNDVTEKMEAESKLLRSQMLLVTSQRISKTGSWELTLPDDQNLENVQTYWSDQTFRIFGIEPDMDKASKDVYLSYVHKDDVEYVKGVLKKTVDSNSEYRSEHRIIRSDGVERIVRLHGNIIRDPENKRSLKIIGTIVDVTAQKDAENKIALLSAAVEQSPLSIVITDKKGKILFANPKFTDISGYSSEECVGQNPRILKSGYTTDSEYQNLWKTISSGNKWEGEFYNRKKDGGFYWESAIITPVFNRSGVVTNYMAIKTDITEKKEKEQKLQFTEAKFRAVTETANDAIISAESSGIIVGWNKGATKIFGYTEEEMEGENVNRLFAQNDLKEIAHWIEIHSDTESIHGTTIEVNGLHKSGNSFPVELSLATWENVGKAFFTAIIRDISERKLEERFRAKMMQELIQRNKDLEQFTYIVSHNLRSPVANIKGTSDILIHTDNSNEENRLLLNGLSVSVYRLDEVISDLNNILQLKHNIKESNSRICLSEIVEEIIASLVPDIQESGFKISFDFTAINEINSLRTYIYSIFLNLITNSIKYKRAGVESGIEIKSTRIGDKMILSFKDNGIGIDLEHQGEHIFGLYKRFHFHTEGKGIGLHLVKTQVETLGGDIEVHSIVNEGTEFRITLKNE